MCGGGNISPVIGLSTAATGSFINAVGTFSNARASRNTANANADYADVQARDAIRRGRREESDRRRATRQLVGRQRASLAARGVDITEGSPLEILVSTELMGELDAATIRENAAREAEGHRTVARNYRTEAGSTNPFLSATGSLLTSAGAVADRWYQYSKTKKGT